MPRPLTRSADGRDPRQRPGAGVPLRVGVTAALVVLALVPVGIAMALQWDVDAHGMLVHNGKLPGWDFTSTWAGGVLGRQGRFDVVYDHVAYLEWLRSLFGPKLAAHEWLLPLSSIP